MKIEGEEEGRIGKLEGESDYLSSGIKIGEVKPRKINASGSKCGEAAAGFCRKLGHFAPWLWIPILLWASPIFVVIYREFTKRGFSWIVEWFTDFSWQWRPNLYGSTEFIITSGVLRFGIFLMPLFFGIIVVRYLSVRPSFAERSLYYVCTSVCSLLAIVTCFPNRAISIINTMGYTERRGDALLWTLSIWIMVIALSILLVIPKVPHRAVFALWCAIAFVSAFGVLAA